MIVLAGKRYREFIVPALPDRIQVEIPMEHLPVGKQLRWLDTVRETL